jgi:glycosyltransferase involved in cell wall biosynthesis
MQESVGRYVVVMDSDLQNPPEEIYKLLHKAEEGYSLISGVRVNRTESKFLRKIPSTVANYLLRRITTCPSKDMGGFKCIEGDMARSLHLRAGQHRLLPALVWLKGGHVADVDTTSHPRFAGQSHYGLSRSVDVLFDIILFGLQNSFKARQIYLFGRLSLWTFMFSMGVLIWVFTDKFAFGVALANRPPFFLGLAGLMFAFMLLTFGFVLEMISNVYARVSDAKPYFIRRRV